MIIEPGATPDADKPEKKTSNAKQKINSIGRAS